VVIPDVNILIHAFREDTAQHDAALTWLTARLGDPGDDVAVPDLIWVGFARITTNSRIFHEPSSIAEVTAFAQAVMAQPTYRSIPGLSDGVGPLFTLMAQSESRGNLVTDTYIAAIARQYGATVATFDRDFRRFDDLRLVTP
jgi:toxin-antitoxin system PIN domain toxin